MKSRIDYLESRVSDVLRGVPVRDLDEAFSGVRTQIKRQQDMLAEAAAQIECLHAKFQETGSGNAVLAQIMETLRG